MGFSGEGAAGGAASGAAAGTAISPGWGTLIGGVAGGLMGGFGGKKTTKQVPLETPEQKAARQQLLGFAQTGRFGDFLAGEKQALEFGDFTPTGIEQTGLSNLQRLLAGGIPDQFKLGDEALASFLNPDPAATAAQFDPFRAQIERQIEERGDAFKRSAGFSGDLFSRDTQRGLGDIQVRGQETLTAELARLVNQAQERRLAAIPLAFQSGQAQQNAQLQQIEASQQIGSLTRRLNDQGRRTRDAELLRRRQELLLPIDAARTVAGGQSTFGVPSITTSPFQEFLGLAGKIGGQFLGDEISNRQTERSRKRQKDQGTL